MTEALSAVTTTIFGSGGCVATAFSWITSAEVLPYFAIGIGCSLALFGVKVIRSVVWGS